MKRLFVFVALLATATSCFASGSSSDSDFITFLGIILFIWGILQIILFFKVWGMTNDIRDLKKDYFNENVFSTKIMQAKYLRKSLVLDNKDNVKRILLQDFIDNVEKSYEQLPEYGYGHLENGTYVSLKEENLRKTIRPYVEKLQEQFDKIGEELPVYIQRMETYGDYFNLFTQDDLIVKVKKDKKEE